MRTDRFRRFVTPLFALLCVASAFAACSDKVNQPGQLMVAVQTDMALPKDVDRVRIEIVSFGQLQFGNEYEVGPAGLKIPATLGVVAGKNANAPVTIRVIAKKGTEAKVLREVVTTVPTSRTALLRIPIQWLCFEQNIKQTANQVETTCPTDQTCSEGICQDAHVDSSTLPDYAPAEVFGGGSENGDGQCYDTLSCMNPSQDVQLDANCSFAIAGDVTNLNVALHLPPTGQGICDSVNCFVPLDGTSATGWKYANGRVTLPRAVCQKKYNVAASLRCPTKSEKTPTCGPWSAVSGQPSQPVADGGSIGPILDGGNDGATNSGELILAIGQTAPRNALVLGGDLYWANGAPFGADAGALPSMIVKCNQNGCGSNPTVLVNNATGTIGSFALSPLNIVFSRLLGGGNSEVSQCPISGCGVGGTGAPTPVASPPAFEPPATVAFDGTNVYFLAGTTLGRCSNLAVGCGGAYTNLAPAGVATPNNSLVIDNLKGLVYWAESGRLASCTNSVGCGSGNTLNNNGQIAPRGLEMNGSILTWLNYGSMPSIWDCDTNSCSGRTITSGSFDAVTTDTQFVYFAGFFQGSYGIGKLGKAPGDTIARLATLISPVSSIAVDNQYVYATTADSVIRYNK